MSKQTDTIKEEIYETIVFGWILQGMGGDTLENVKKARELLAKLKLSTRQQTLQEVEQLEIMENKELLPLDSRYDRITVESVNRRYCHENDLRDKLRSSLQSLKEKEGK